MFWVSGVLASEGVYVCDGEEAGSVLLTSAEDTLRVSSPGGESLVLGWGDLGSLKQAQNLLSLRQRRVPR